MSRILHSLSTAILWYFHLKTDVSGDSARCILAPKIYRRVLGQEHELPESSKAYRTLASCTFLAVASCMWAWCPAYTPLGHARVMRAHM